MVFNLETYVAPSQIVNGGKGLFTNKNIKAGELIWSYSDDTCVQLTEKHFEHLLNSEDCHVIMMEYLKYSYPSGDRLIFILDNGRFINHSDIPNCYTVNDQTYALRDINEHEELLENYLTYGDLSDLIKKLHIQYQIWHPDLVLDKVVESQIPTSIVLPENQSTKTEIPLPLLVGIN